MMSQDPEFYLPQDLSRLLKIPLSSVYELARKNKIPGARKIGKHWRFLKSAIQTWAVQQKDQPIAQKQVSEDGQQTLRQNTERKILLIEDDATVLKTLKTLLSRYGYNVVACADGVEGFERFKKDAKWGLIISDIRMANQDGIETVEKIRKLERETQRTLTPVILVTAYAETDYPLRAIKLGVRDYFLKPFNTKDFLASVQNSIYSYN